MKKAYQSPYQIRYKLAFTIIASRISGSPQTNSGPSPWVEEAASSVPSPRFSLTDMHWNYLPMSFHAIRYTGKKRSASMVSFQKEAIELSIHLRQTCTPTLDRIYL